MEPPAFNRATVVPLANQRSDAIAGPCFALCSLMMNRPNDPYDRPALQRDPDEWKTGDEPMTDPQRSYLETLCRETGEAFDDSLSKAEASKRIEELRERSPRLSSD
jgi:hypothetical protein